MRRRGHGLRPQADGSPFPGTITSLTRVAEDKNTRWDPHGQATTYSGKQCWSSRHQPFFKEDSDARGKDDVASPVGEWTKVECLCSGSRLTITINSLTVNACTATVPAAGKILLQSEGDEVFFRNLLGTASLAAGAAADTPAARASPGASPGMSAVGDRLSSAMPWESSTSPECRWPSRPSSITALAARHLEK